jgi:hypothetical protein
MSGGSYDYLCFKEAHELLAHEGPIGRMADRLAKMGAADAARETEDLLLTLRQFQNRIQTRLDRLCPIWKAVEWVDSGDWGPDSIAEALADYRGESRPSEDCKSP